MEYEVVVTPTFEKELKKLRKNPPKIDIDFEMLLIEIENGHLGDDIAGVLKDGNKVFKKRMSNSSANKSKRGGFRVIEYLVTEDNTIYLLTIYSKSDQVDIATKKIKKLIDKI